MLTKDVEIPTSQALNRCTAKWQAPHYVKSLLMGIPAIFLGFQISGWVFAVRALQQGRVDFRAQYTAGYIIRSGNAHLLYDYGSQLIFQNRLVTPRDVTMPFDHLAYEAVFFSPFSYLPFKSAYFVFLVINLIALAVSVLLIRRWTSTLDNIFPWVTPVLIGVFLPTAVALMQGQESVLLLLCLIVSFSALEKGNDLLAGAVLSLALFKFQIALPIAFLFLLWRRWRFVLGFSSCAVALIAGSFELVGRQATASYIGLLLSMSVRLHSVVDQARLGVPPTAMPNLRGLIIGLFGQRLFGTSTQIAILILSAIVMLAAYLRGRKVVGGRGLLIAILAAALVSYHSLIHDMTILLLPIVVLLSECIPAVPNGVRGHRLIAGCAALLFTAPVLFCFAPEDFYLASLATIALFSVFVRWMPSLSIPQPLVLATRDQ